MILNHPEVATRDCQHCLKYQYDDDGNVMLGRDGKPDERYFACWAPCRDANNQPLPIGKLDENGNERACSKCPKGTAENQLSLLPQMQICYDHYRECRAVGSFPDDPIVRRCARIVRDVEDRAEQDRQAGFQSVLMSLAMRH